MEDCRTVANLTNRSEYTVLDKNEGADIIFDDHKKLELPVENMQYGEFYAK
jgi:hypothetical protein